MKNILNHIEEILGMVCLFPGVMISFISRLGGGDKSSHRCKADGSYEL